MEQHPVPQNVTTFQFRLIGDMTIKQFGYLAGGAILAYVCYKLPLPFFFTWPMAIISGLAGFGFAFIPVEERPMDIWVMSFIKNVYNPTQFVWEKTPETQKPAAPAPSVQTAPMRPSVAAPTHSTPVAPQTTGSATTPTRPVSDVLQGIFASPKTVTPPAQAPAPVPPAHFPAAGATQSPTVHPAQSAGPFDWLFALFTPVKKTTMTSSYAQHTAAAAQTAPSVSTPSVTGRHLDLTPPPKVITQEAAAQTAHAKELEVKAPAPKQALESKTQTHVHVLELQKQLTDTLTERDRMKKEIETLRSAAPAPAPKPMPSPVRVTAPVAPPAAQQPIAPPPAAPTASAQGPTAQAHTGPTVKIITPQDAVKAGLPRLTTFPNVVTGITRDSDNNFLPGVLVTVRDHDSVPVRALKTNRLGQFAASTPLSNGTYFVEIEDPRGRYTFDRVQITLNGSIVPALEIIAKSQKEVARDKLAKEIFGS